MPEGYGYDKEGIIQFLIDKFAGAPDVQAPPSQVQNPLNRFGELRRPQRGLGGPRNSENLPNDWHPEGQRSTRRRTRGTIDHSKRLPDIPGEGIQGFLKMLQANPQDPMNRRSAATLAGLDPSLLSGLDGLGGAVGGRLTESDIRSAERKLPQRRGPAPVGYANPRTR